MLFSNAALVLAPLAGLIGHSSALTSRASNCRYLPGDSGWPSKATWNSLNTTVGGRLIATVPLGSPCHDPNYDAAACTALQQEWTSPGTHMESSSSVMQTYFANQSCDPFLSQSTPCTLGNYIVYAINASTSAHAVAAVKFAKAHNIRLVVRNTGHDYFGRSTGAGALAIWTHNMKGIDFIDVSESYYKGPAIRIGPGVQGYDAVEAAGPKGLVVVTGECPTVGLAGFTMGGGHSALSSSFGLGADQALEYEVVTASGSIVTASPRENSDLYWALSGGGPGTWGVVTSFTIRAHYAGDVGGASLLMAPSTVNASVIGNKSATDVYYEGIEKFHALLPDMIDEGATVVYTLSSQGLSIQPVTLFNSTGDVVKSKVLGPFVKAITALGIEPVVSYTTLPYLEHYSTYMGPLPDGSLGVESYQFGGRLIPKTVLELNNLGFSAVIRKLHENGVITVGSSGSFKGYSGISNAVLPAWRSAIVSMQLITLWDSTEWSEMLSNQKNMTADYVPWLEAVTPLSGAYLNEADFRQPNWKTDFHGINYAKLLAIKVKWDPDSLFYTLKGVGSDAWSIADDGRMCKNTDGVVAVLGTLWSGLTCLTRLTDCK